MVAVQEPGPASTIPDNGRGALWALYAQRRPTRLITYRPGYNTLIPVRNINSQGQGGGSVSRGEDKDSNMGRIQQGSTGRETIRVGVTLTEVDRRWEMGASAKRLDGTK